MHIKDRTFIISGGSSGLGLATARNLYSHGGYIAILDLDASSAEDAVKEIGSERTRFFEADVSETESIENAVAAVAAWVKESGKAIGGLVSAAGVGNPGKVRVYKAASTVTSFLFSSLSLTWCANLSRLLTDTTSLFQSPP